MNCSSSFSQSLALPAMADSSSDDVFGDLSTPRTAATPVNKTHFEFPVLAPPSLVGTLSYKIGDLGHATPVDRPAEDDGDVRYLPSEILEQNFAHLCKTDVFSLGMTLYEAASLDPLPLNGELWQQVPVQRVVAGC